MLLRLFLACFACVVCSRDGMASANAQNAVERETVESERLLRSDFDLADEGRILRLTNSGKKHIIELCFDGCDVFEWTKPGRITEVWDLVFLYEYHHGVGSALEQFEARGKDLLPIVLKKYPNLCPADIDPQKALECVLVSLAARNGLRVGILKYDEGLRCVAWLDLRALKPLAKFQCAKAKGVP